MSFTLPGPAVPFQTRRPPREPVLLRPRVAAPALPRTGRVPLALVDTAAVTVGTLVTLVAAPRGGFAPGPIGWMVLFGILTGLVLRKRGLYRFHLRSSALDELYDVAVCTAISAGVLIVVRSIVAPDLGVAGESIRLWAFVTTFLVALRTSSALLNRRASPQGRAQNTLILGAGAVGVQMAQRLLERPELGLRPVGFLDKEPLAGLTLGEVPVLGASWDLEREVGQHHVTQVVFAFSTAPHHVYLDLVRRCHALGVGVFLVPRLFEKVAGAIEMAHVGGMALLKVTPVGHRGWQFKAKHQLDRVIAALALLVLSPVMLVVALAVRLTSPGPVFYRQRRVGRDAREFEMLKFRTMYDSPDRVGGGRAAWAAAILHPEAPLADVAADCRTPIGRLLRRFSFDETPQLINVLRGEMSLVGPRPETPLLVEGFQSRVYRYEDRHRVKCGITGWAQVHGLRGDTSLSDRVEWDNYYIENWSPWLDLKILLMTVPAALRGRNAG